jgi:hypothetical protein
MYSVRALAAISLSLLAGCTILTSESLEDLNKSSRAPRGVHYSLPKGVIDVKLSVEPQKANFKLSLENVRYIPDPSHRYYLQYLPHPSYKDEISVATTKDGLLTTVNTDTTDLTPAIIVNLTKALTRFAALEAAPLGEGEEVLLTMTFDPLNKDERERAIHAVNKEIKLYLNKIALKSCSYFAAGGLDAHGENVASPSDQSLSHWQGKETTLAREVTNLTAQKSIIDERVKRALRKAGRIIDVLPGSFLCEADPKKTNESKKASNGKKPNDGKNAGEPPKSDAKCDSYIYGEGAPGKDGEDPGKDAPVKPDRECEAEILKRVCILLKGQAAVGASLTKQQGKLADVEAKSKEIADQRKKQRSWCGAYEGLASDPPTAKIEVHDYADRDHKPGWAAAVSHTTPARVATDCTVGICYRPKEPFRITYALDAGDDTIIVDMPNRADLVAIDITRTFLVKKIQKMTFEEGFLAEVFIDKKSELVAAAKLPIDILNAVADGLQARVKVTTEHKSLAQKELELLKAEKALRDAQAKFESAPAREAGFEASARQSSRSARGGASSRAVVLHDRE